MKIAIVGCGALGSFYGAKLCRDSREVHFLLRSDYEVVRSRGVAIHSPEGDFNARPRCARTPQEIGPADLVLIGLKTTANDQFPKLLPPLVGPQTAVLTLQNGLGNEEALAALLPPSQILGGLCFVCLNRVAPGVVHHLDHGRVILGEFSGWPEPRTHDICTMFKRAGIPCEVTGDLARAHWEKLVWNIPFNGLGVAASAGLDAFEPGTPPAWSAGLQSAADADTRHETNPPSPGPPGPLRVANPRSGPATPGCAPSARVAGSCLDTAQLLADPAWLRMVRELMMEVVRAARAQGMNVGESLVETLIARTRTMGAYKASTLIDFERGQPLELESLFLEPLRRARRAGVATPRMESLCSVLNRLGAPVHGK